MFKEISTQDLNRVLADSNTKIMDVRSADAYNGWKTGNEVRGGHIRGSICLPAKWNSYIDWIEIVRSRGILPENNLIIYGNNDSDLEKVANRFNAAGYENIMLYKRFEDEWSSNEVFPMDHLSRYRHLVSVATFPEQLIWTLSPWKLLKHGTAEAPKSSKRHCWHMV